MLKYFFCITSFLLLLACQATNPIFVYPSNIKLDGNYQRPHQGVFIVLVDIKIEDNKFIHTEWVHSPIDDPRYDGLKSKGSVLLEGNTVILNFNDNRQSLKFRVIKNGRKIYLFPAEQAKEDLDVANVNLNELFTKNGRNH